MASAMTPPSNGELWHLSIDDLLGPVPETFRLGGSGPFVINLRSSSTSMSPLPTSLPGFEKFHLYQVQRVEDDALRFRMRLGLFTSEDEADAVLLKVRDDYPCALTATAAADDLQAIELLPKPRTPVMRTATPVAADPVPPTSPPFELFPAEPVAVVVKPPPPHVIPVAPVAPVAPVFKQPATPAAITVGLLATAPLPVAKPAATAAGAPSAPPVRTHPPAAPAPLPMVVKGTIAKPASAKPAPAVAPAVAVAPAIAPAKVSAMASMPAIASPAQSPGSGKRRETDLESTQTVRRLTPAELSAQLRWFVIELALTEHAIDPETVPNLDIFGLYRLYSVAEIEGGRRMHALRLGFFSEEIAAKAVASYLAGYYDKPTIKRVSVGERERFSEQGIQARKDVGATGMHAAIEITADRHARPVRKPVTPP